MELPIEWRKSRENVLVILILDKIAARLFKKYSLSTGRILGTVFLFLLFEFIQIITMLIAKRPIEPVLWASLMVSCITCLCFFSIASCHQYALELWETNIQTTSFRGTTEMLLINWLKTSANLRYQILASIILVISTLSYSLIFHIFVNQWDAIIFVSLIAMGGAQGLYWGITTPLMTTILSKTPVSDFENDPLYPSRSPILMALSKMLIVFATWIAFLTTLIIIFMLFVQPQFQGNGTVYLLILIGVSYLVCTWTFVYPQFNLSQIIRQIKENTLFQIQSEINQIYQSLHKLDQPAFERLKNLMELHEIVSKRSNTLVDLSTFQIFVGSFFTPTLAAIIGVIDWHNLLQKIFPNFP